MSQKSPRELEGAADVSSDGYDWSTLQVFSEIFDRLAKLKPRNRYLLLRGLWVTFDLDKLHAEARKAKKP